MDGQGAVLRVGRTQRIGHRIAIGVRCAGQRGPHERGVFVGRGRTVCGNGGVVDRIDSDVARIGIRRERACAATDRGIDFVAGCALGLVPGAEHDCVVQGAGKIRFRFKVQQRLRVGLQQQRLRQRNCTDVVPGRAAIGRIMPGAVCRVGSNKRDAGHGAGVGIHDVRIAAGQRDETGNRSTDGTRGRAGVFVFRIQDRGGRKQRRRIVDVGEAHGAGDGVAQVVDGAAIVGLDVECRRNFAAVVNKAHVAGGDIRGGEARCVAPDAAAEQLEIAMRHARHCVGEARAVRIGDADVSAGEHHGAAFRDCQRGAVEGRRVVDVGEAHGAGDGVAEVVDGAAIVGLDVECRRNFAAVVNKAHVAGGDIRGGEARCVAPDAAAEQLEIAMRHARHCVGEARAVRIGDADVSAGEHHGAAFRDCQRGAVEGRRIVDVGEAHGAGDGVAVGRAIIGGEGKGRRNFAAVVNKAHIAGGDIRGGEACRIAPDAAAEQLEIAVGHARYRVGEA